MSMWKDIPGYEGLYQVSDQGQVKSLEKRRLVGRTTNVRVYPETILKPGTHKFGYPQVLLYRNGKRELITVHRLVMLAFVGLPDSDQEIRHRNGDATDCRLSNLVYGSRQDNANDRVKHGKAPRGSDNPNSKLNEETVRQIRARIESGETMKAVATELNIGLSTVSSVCKRETWKHV